MERTINHPPIRLNDIRSSQFVPVIIRGTSLKTINALRPQKKEMSSDMISVIAIMPQANDKTLMSKNFDTLNLYPSYKYPKNLVSYVLMAL
jgi:hypothetical protein